MAKYRVVALAVGGLGNRIFRPSDIVTERNFPAGNIDHLVETGAVVKLKETSKAELTADPVEIKPEPLVIPDPEDPKSKKSGKGKG